MDNVYDFLLNKIQLNKNDIVVAGVSAGPDSMALLYILNELSQKINFKIVVAHVNHNIREESKEEETFLRDYCQKLNISFESMTITNYGDDNFHNEARNIRYRFYDELMEKYQAKYLMTGHHGDDLMETILMRIVRGSTLKGYSGFNDIINKGNYKIVRPLIFLTKEEIKTFDDENHIPYRIDKSNFKDKYTRNRYRKNVLPFLKQEDQNVHQKFLKFSKTLLAYDDLLDKLTKMSMEDVIHDGIILRDKFLALEPLIGKRIIEYELSKLYHDDMMEIDDRHVNLIMKAISSNKTSLVYCLPNDYMVVREYNKIYFKKNIDALMPYDIEITDEVFLPNNMKLIKVSSESKDGNDILRINSKDVSLPLRVRTRRVGDRMTIKNMTGTKKVSDIMIDSKIPLSKRDNWPIVVDAKDEVIWIPKIKKSKYNRLKSETCDIIIKCL